jgi:hypothetical protein
MLAASMGVPAFKHQEFADIFPHLALFYSQFISGTSTEPKATAIHQRGIVD